MKVASASNFAAENSRDSNFFLGGAWGPITRANYPFQLFFFFLEPFNCKTFEKFWNVLFVIS
jgi:hypothetical protein